MEYVIGSALALGVGVFATVSGFDRSRTFYATVLILVGTYTILFAIIAGAHPALELETAAWAPFLILAIIGFKRAPWLVAAGLIAHGLWDVVRSDLIVNPGMPAWWPGFCMSYDLVAGLYLAVLLIARNQRLEDFSAAIGSAVEKELRFAKQADEADDAVRSFRHLERAHVLSQPVTGLHVRVHARMLAWGFRYRRPREIVGQLFRLVGAAALTRLRAVPHGNTGGTNVSAFQTMPISPDLAEIIAQAQSHPVARLNG